MTDSRLVVYNASAGSGKTFQIATRYLNRLIQAQSPHIIYRLIGITFTNKAAEEMKKRIIENLIKAAQGNISDVMSVVSRESESVVKKQTGIGNDVDYQQEIIKRSRQRLTEILHYYDDFQLTTIDKLMYKIIKTFAREMQLSGDVEVTLEYKETVNHLIDQLINRAEAGSLLSKFLIAFALNKIEDDKFWDIKEDLVKINQIIFDDNHFKELKSLEDKTLEDFVRLNTFLNKQIKQIEKQLTGFGQALEKAFQGYEHLINVRVLARDLQYNKSKIQIKQKTRKQFEGENIYYVKSKVKTLESDLQVVIKENVNQAIHQILMDLIPFLDENLEQYRFLIALKKEVNALSIENELQKDIAAFKTEHNTIFISDFNKLILEQILNDLVTDTPYIYMRLGEKYAHYLIDEFQDTSALQWQNLIPLIREALSKEFGPDQLGDTMIVGDAKQSIYRFRGGKPEQFIALSDSKQQVAEGNPFAPLVKKSVKQLAYNWRSNAKIITFNNLFFKEFVQYLEPPYRQVYEQATQKIPKWKNLEEGYVKIRFLNRGSMKQGVEKEDFAEAVYQAIQQAEAAGFGREDICVLVNRHNEGMQIANFLNQQAVDVISSETLLVQNAQKVGFLLSWLYFLKTGASQDLYKAVRYLTEAHQLDKNATYEQILTDKNLDKETRIQKFQELNYDVDYQRLINLSIYDLLVYLIDIFKLNETQTEQAYLQAFMEKVFQMNLKSALSLSDFLSAWEQIAEKFSIAAPDKKGAVNIMTVHKSKGLEFPVVIYYTNEDLFSSKDKDTKVWVPLDPGTFEGFEVLPVSLGSLEHSTNPDYQAIFKKISMEKIFDNLNRLYVAMTRAESQLYILTYSPSGSAKNIGFNQIIYNFLKREFKTFDGQMFEYGQIKNLKNPMEDRDAGLNLPQLYYKYWQQREGDNFIKINTSNYEHWAENKKQAIIHGLLIHDILSKITTKADWQNNQSKYLNALSETEKSIIKQQIETILQHSQLKKYFSGEYTVLNERSILIPQTKGTFTQKRPDRLLLKDHKMIIIDYKTGAALPKHVKQLNEYASTLEQMGFNVAEKVLIYIGEKTEVNSWV